MWPDDSASACPTHGPRLGVSPIEHADVRAGLHTGEAILEAGDFFGKHVNLAARIASQAKAGEVLVSSLLRELTESSGDIDFGDARQVELKGLTGTQRVFSVHW